MLDRQRREQGREQGNNKVRGVEDAPWKSRCFPGGTVAHGGPVKDQRRGKGLRGNTVS